MAIFVRHVKGFSDEQNALIRAFVGQYIAKEFDGNQSRAARAIGVKQGTLNEFMAKKRGAGMKLIECVARSAGVPIGVVLGESELAVVRETPDQFPSRAAAVKAWKQASDQAIESVMSMRFKGAEGFGVAEWTNYLDTALRSFRRGDGNDPRLLRGARIATEDDD